MTIKPKTSALKTKFQQDPVNFLNLINENFGENFLEGVDQSTIRVEDFQAQGERISKNYGAILLSCKIDGKSGYIYLMIMEKGGELTPMISIDRCFNTFDIYDMHEEIYKEEVLDMPIIHLFYDDVHGEELLITDYIWDLFDEPMLAEKFMLDFLKSDDADVLLEQCGWSDIEGAKMMMTSAVMCVESSMLEKYEQDLDKELSIN